VREHNYALDVLTSASQPRNHNQEQEFLMRSKLAISALVAATLFGATAIASAQTEPMQPADQGSAATGSKMAPGKTKSNNMKQGATTGMAPQGTKPGSVDESKPGGRSTARTGSGN
jgi:hypothetical protein